MKKSIKLADKNVIETVSLDIGNSLYLFLWFERIEGIPTLTRCKNESCAVPVNKADWTDSDACKLLVLFIVSHNP